MFRENEVFVVHRLEVKSALGTIGRARKSVGLGLDFFDEAREHVF